MTQGLPGAGEAHMASNIERAASHAERALTAFHDDVDGDRERTGDYWSGYLAHALEEIVRELRAGA